MLTKLYLDTTNPKIGFNELLCPTIFYPMLVSVVLHTIIYALFVNMASWIFVGRVLSSQTNIRLILVLVLIMFFGFFARYYHVKDIYNAYHQDMEKTRNHLDTLYISWVFIS